MRTLALILFFCSALAHAETIDPRVAKFDTCGRFELFSINGIMTDFIGATDNLNRIKAVYGNAYKGHLIKYVVAYNQTRGLKTDFLDSAKQVIAGYAGATWDKWMNAVTFGVYNLGLSATASAEIAKRVTDLYGFTKPSPYQDDDLYAIANAVLAGTQGGGRRLLFGHSQGNLYMNLVYDKLIAMGMNPKTLGVVGLAVPYSSLRTGNVYTTSANDVVIDAVRVATLGNVLPPTMIIPYAPTVDPLGHNLIKTYFASSGARNQTISNITAEFGRIISGYGAVRFLEYPSEAIYASAQWDYSCGTMYNGTAWVARPECYSFWTVAPYNESQHVIVEPGSAAQARSTVLINGKACYKLAVEGIKQAQLTRPATSSWVWFTMGYPNNYGCWDMVSGNPATDYRAGAWWLYGGDSPPQWKVKGPIDPYTGLTTTVGGGIYAVGGAVCKT